jgi:hypothetical protein
LSADFPPASERREIVNFNFYVSLAVFGVMLSSKIDSFFLAQRPDGLSMNGVYTTALYIVAMLEIPTRAIINISTPLLSKATHDNDLKKELQSIEKYLAQGQISFAPTHQTVRDDIVQTLRNKGKIKYGPNQKFNQITKWDLLDISEVNLASKYFVLEKIFWQASGAPGDKFSVRQREAKSEGDKAFDLAFLSLDEDDTGKDPGKMNVRQMVYVERV